MKDKFNRYFENLNRIWVIAKPDGAAVDSEQQWLDMIQENANETRMLRMENQSILHEEILYFDTHVEELDQERVDQLSEFAEQLMEFQKQVDLGLAYHIHVLLLHYGQYHGDTDLIIKEAYHAGLALYYMNRTSDVYGLNDYREEDSNYFNLAASYLPKLNEFASKETRGYILRSLANIRLIWPSAVVSEEMTEKFGVQKVGVEERIAYNRKILSIFSDPKLQQENPDLPWEDYLYAIHFGVSALLTFLREEDNQELADFVMESMNYVYEKNVEKTGKSYEMWSARLIYSYNAARFHAKKITRMEFLDLLLVEHEKAKLDDWSGDGVYRSLNLMNYIREYYKGCTQQEREVLEPRMNRANDYCWRYIRRLPLGEFLNVVTNFLRDMTSVYDQKTDVNEYSNYLLNYILACHQPTYVHSLMVAYLSRELAGRMISMSPEYFIGMPGINHLSDVEINRAQILRFAYECGLYHDIGKGAILNFVGIYGRNLFDEEFHLLQIHPYIGYDTMQEFANSRQIEEAAYGHHKWYDNTRGYPQYFDTSESKIKQIIDIISVADSVDAATDDVGRSYANAKKLPDMMEEFRGFRGTRYAPQVVDLLLDETYLRQLDQSMREERNRSYLLVYKDAQIGKARENQDKTQSEKE